MKKVLFVIMSFFAMTLSAQNTLYELFTCMASLGLVQESVYQRYRQKEPCFTFAYHLHDTSLCFRHRTPDSHRGAKFHNGSYP